MATFGRSATRIAGVAIIVLGGLVGSYGGIAAQAAGAVAGRVTDRSTGAPVGGAWIRIAGTGRAAQAGGDGRYRVTGVPPGAWTVSAQAIGYAAGRAEVTVTGGQEVALDLMLDAQAVLLSDVVVSVSREEQSRAEASASIAVVDQAELERARPHHPADVMSRVPGAWVTNLSGEGHFTAIRQPITTKPVYAYLEDGVPIRSTGFFNHNALYEINLPQAGRVEVIKGPGTALYGSDAVGGVVSAFTRPPTERPGGEVFVEGGRFGYGRALLSGSGTWRDDGIRADLNITRSDSYRDGAPYARQSGTLRWDRTMGSGWSMRTVVSASHIDQPGDGGSDLSEADFASRPRTNYSPIAFRRVVAVRASSALERRGALSLAAATLYARYNELDLMPSWQLSFDPQIWEIRHRSLGLLTRYRRTLVPFRSNLSVGMDLEVSPGAHFEQRIVPTRDGARFVGYTEAETQYDYDVTFWQASPYVQLEVTPWDRLRVDLGLRADNMGYDYDTHLAPLATGTHRRPPSGGVTYARLSPKLGATLELLDGVRAFASYRAAFRAPSEGQLFRQGSALNTVDLEPVKAHNYEFGLRAAGRRVSAEATAYQLDIRDDILTFFDPTTGLRQASNAGATRHRGVELGISAVPAAGVRLDGAWALTRQVYQEWRPNPSTDFGGRKIETAPSNMGRLGATLTPEVLRGGFLGVEWVHLGSYWMDPANTERYGGFDLVHVSASVPVVAGLAVAARIHNLADSRYAETSSFNAAQGRRYRPGQPRTLYLGVQYSSGGARARR